MGVRDCSHNVSLFVVLFLVIPFLFSHLRDQLVFLDVCLVNTPPSTNQIQFAYKLEHYEHPVFFFVASFLTITWSPILIVLLIVAK